MTPTEAAAILVQMYGRLRNYMSSDARYEEAIALACAALSKREEEITRGD